MLSVQTIQLLGTGLVTGGVIGFLGAIPYLKKKGVNVDGIANKVSNIADTSGKILDVADEILPNNPVLFFLKNLDKFAKIAAGEAQQLSHAGDISIDKRLETARNAVYNILNELNIELTDNRKALIDSAIQDAVNELGHKDPTAAQQAATQQALQAQVTQLTSEKAQLQNTISTINNATSAVTKTA